MPTPRRKREKLEALESVAHKEREEAIDAQLYPTYNVYVIDDAGSLQLQAQLPQAAQPIQNFTNPSYPRDPDLSLLFRQKFYTD